MSQLITIADFISKLTSTYVNAYLFFLRAISPTVMIFKISFDKKSKSSSDQLRCFNSEWKFRECFTWNSRHHASNKASYSSDFEFYNPKICRVIMLQKMKVVFSCDSCRKKLVCKCIFLKIIFRKNFNFCQRTNYWWTITGKKKTIGHD